MKEVKALVSEHFVLGQFPPSLEYMVIGSMLLEFYKVFGVVRALFECRSCDDI